MERIFRESHESLLVCILQDWLWAWLLLFRHSGMSNSANPWTAAHRTPCPSPTLRAGSNSCPLSQWCHPTILSSVVPFSCLQSFPTSGSFLMSQLFVSSGQSATWESCRYLSCLVGTGYSQFSFHLLRNLIFWCPSIPATVQKEINRINVCYRNIWMSHVPFLSPFASEGEEAYNFV